MLKHTCLSLLGCHYARFIYKCKYTARTQKHTSKMPAFSKPKGEVKNYIHPVFLPMVMSVHALQRASLCMFVSPLLVLCFLIRRLSSQVPTAAPLSPRLALSNTTCQSNSVLDSALQVAQQVPLNACACFL